VEDYPNNLIEFEKRFNSEEECYCYLFQIRWPNGVVCPHCKGEGKTWTTKRGLYNCPECGYQISVTSGTIFHGTRKPLVLWFHAMWHITSQKYGANALGLMRVLGLGSYHTAWEWLHKLRRAMVRPGRDMLSGVVEVDETYVGGEKTGTRGRGAEGKSLVMVAVELDSEHKKKIGRIRLSRVLDASSISINKFLEENIEKGSVIDTDGWNGYNQVNLIGYIRNIVRDSESLGSDPLNHCHLIISLFKRWLLGTYQGAVKPDHVDFYLDEYTFRFNRRKSRSRGKLFYRLIQQAVAVEPVPRNKIEGGSPLNLYF
jgi:transposase-like protein